ncbi:MAG: RimK family alpha-L-glutamate ligase, partial [Thermohalobaculum sp.]|nr:RimK family alpha-L-glutamate ligase [Thermohalobaculum sp.]
MRPVVDLAGAARGMPAGGAAQAAGLPPLAPGAVEAEVADLWLLFRCDDAGRAAENHCNRRLIEAAAARGFAAAIVDPAGLELDAGAAAPRGEGRVLRLPRAAMQRSGARLGRAGHALLDRLGALGVAVPAAAGASARAADKLACARALAAAGLPVPATVALGDPPDPLRLARRVGFPMVLKAARSTRGQAVRLCPDPAALAVELAALRATPAAAGRLIAQRYVPRSHGRDLRVLVIGGRVRAAMLRAAEGSEFRANVALGGRAEAVEPEPAAADLACRAAEVLGLGIAAVDLLFDRTGFSICEVNTAPGFEALEAASG